MQRNNSLCNRHCNHQPVESPSSRMGRSRILLLPSHSNVNCPLREHGSWEDDLRTNSTFSSPFWRVAAGRRFLPWGSNTNQRINNDPLCGSGSCPPRGDVATQWFQLGPPKPGLDSLNHSNATISTCLSGQQCSGRPITRQSLPHAWHGGCTHSLPQINLSGASSTQITCSNNPCF